MEITREDVMEAVLTNDTERVAKILEVFGFTNNMLPVLTTENISLVQAVLRYASILDTEADVDYRLADELIGRIAMGVDIFSFLQMATLNVDFVSESYDEIPEEIREAFEIRIYREETAEIIRNMSLEEFESLVAFLVYGDIDALGIKYNIPIIQRMYDLEIFPSGLFWAYMGLCIYDAMKSGTMILWLEPLAVNPDDDISDE